MRKVWCLVLLTGLLTAIFLALIELPSPNELRPTAWHYVTWGVADTGAVNLVNAVLFDYRVRYLRRSNCYIYRCCSIQNAF
ncbi:MAG: hypothetical protein FH749_14215 [Firmicutes bacterium]|nr:hypothetical protein [Bacillota bacterium]